MVTGLDPQRHTRRRAGWASYFLDHSSALPGRPSGRAGDGAPAHCSYVREFLLAGRRVSRATCGPARTRSSTRRCGARGHRAYRERADAARPPQPLLDAGAGWCAITSSAVVPSGASCAGDFESKRRRRSPGLLRFLRALPGPPACQYELPQSQIGAVTCVDEYARVRHLVVLGVAAAWVGACFELGAAAAEISPAQATPRASQG